jgi:hypothetical protein
MKKSLNKFLLIGVLAATTCMALPSAHADEPIKQVTPVTVNQIINGNDIKTDPQIDAALQWQTSIRVSAYEEAVNLEGKIAKALIDSGNPDLKAIIPDKIAKEIGINTQVSYENALKMTEQLQENFSNAIQASPIPNLQKVKIGGKIKEMRDDAMDRSQEYNATHGNMTPR